MNEVMFLIAPGWPNMPWFWDIVTISSNNPLCLPNLLTQPYNQTPHRNLSNLKLHAWLLEPQQSRNRGFRRQWQHNLRLFKKGSTRLAYEAKWNLFTKWYLSNQVDFRAPPVKSIAYILLYLFQECKLQPSTTDGYRSAIC